MSKNFGLGKSHSKIILMGEHSVVYGYPAIALPLHHIEVTCLIQPSEHALAISREDPLVTALHAALDYLKITDKAIRYEIQSTIPERRGMGSSAAIAIAGIRAVFDFYNAPLDKLVLEQLVNQAEIVAHTHPSGLDAKTCLSDKAIKLIRNVGFFELDLDLGAYLVIADTGIHGQTREAVELVKEKGDVALPLLAELGTLTEKVESALADKDLAMIGLAMNVAHDLLSQLGVSCSEADHLVQSARSAGAVGAKMSGGGLGGCVIALAKTQAEASAIAHKLREEGAINTWIESL
ncbi:mevalonate kinase [Streptococcus caprae]|uniref:Mevalonate kinase n=1 Tax=Streptococcus caprae TaxID=1640501 RepID=A0ABV8CV02_9STRE